MQKLLSILILALIFTGCGNDPITNAGYFDDDVDKSVTTEQPNTGAQIFNNYGNGTMNVNNTINYNTIQQSSSSISHTAQLYSISSSSLSTQQKCHTRQYHIQDVYFEFTGDKLFVHNNTECQFMVRWVYRIASQSDTQNQPKHMNATLNAYGVSNGTYVSSSKNICVQIESLEFSNASYSPYGTISFASKTTIQVCNN